MCAVRSLSLSFVLLLVCLCCLCGNSQARYVGGLPTICTYPPPTSQSLCLIDIEGYYYDATTMDCEKYSIGGCRITRGQSFADRQDCLATCVHGTRRIQNLYVNA